MSKPETPLSDSVVMADLVPFKEGRGITGNWCCFHEEMCWQGCNGKAVVLRSCTHVLVSGCGTLVALLKVFLLSWRTEVGVQIVSERANLGLKFRVDMLSVS
jgi:hypothetical protein